MVVRYYIYFLYLTWIAKFVNGPCTAQTRWMMPSRRRKKGPVWAVKAIERLLSQPANDGVIRGVRQGVRI